MLILVTNPVVDPDPNLSPCALRVERRVLAKRLWRGRAEDGTEFGFRLERPLTHAATIHQTSTTRYVLAQEPEPVLVISLQGLPASAAAGVGWAVGNLHLDFSSEADRLIAPDEPAARRLFERIQIPFTATTAVFRPGRFKRGSAPAQVDELGTSHRH